MIKINHNLIKARKNKKLTQKKACGYFGIGERQYQNIEAGTSRGSVDFWIIASIIYDVPLDYLLKQIYDDKLHEFILHENFNTKDTNNQKKNETA